MRRHGIASLQSSVDSFISTRRTTRRLLQRRHTSAAQDHVRAGRRRQRLPSALGKMSLFSKDTYNKLSTMEHLLRLNLLCDDLSDDEFALMLSKCVTHSNRKMIASALFHGLKSNPEFVASFTDIASDVIHTRESKFQHQRSTSLTSHSNQAHSAEHLEELPSALISQCASFLGTGDYFAFGQHRPHAVCKDHGGDRRDGHGRNGREKEREHIISSRYSDWKSQHYQAHPPAHSLRLCQYFLIILRQLSELRIGTFWSSGCSHGIHLVIL